MEDTFKHKGLRRKLVETLRGKGITDEKVLEAIGKVPRHLFMENAFLSHAYEDKAFPIGAGQTISQPYTVAFQTQLLDVQKGQKVLEVGTGSGYQTAVLIELGAKVFTIERQKELYDKTRTLLPKLGYRPKFFYGDGYLGVPAFAPYDRVLVTAGAPKVPDALIEQLAENGKMVIPVGALEYQTMLLVEKKSDQEITTTKHGKFRFVPLLGKRNWKS